jgi:hypothetical protein
MSKITQISTLLIFLVLNTFYTTAQQLTENDKYDYSDGDYYYEIGDFEKAIRFFVKLTTKFPENSKFNYRTGLCYLSIKGDEDKALPYLQKSVKEIDTKYTAISTKSSGAPPEAWLYLGDALHQVNRLLDASQAYHTYLTYVEEDEKAKEKVYKRIQGLGFSYESQFRPSGYSLTNIGNVINSDYSDYNPAISGDQQTMAFTSFRDPKDKIYISYKNAGQWSEPIDITGQVGSKGDCFTSALSYDGSELYMATYDPYNSDIFVSKKVKGKWSKMVPLDKKINSKFSETGVSLSSDGNTIFFSSDRSGGTGGFDIYFSVKEGEEWSKPVNLGTTINTPGNEENPVISADGNKLFFSSDGHESMGGMDILWSSKDENGNWETPVNFGVPVNTPGDDMSFWFNDNTQPGYISRLAENGVGKREIYAVNYIKPPDPVFEELPVISNEIAEEIPANTEPIVVTEVIENVPAKTEVAPVVDVLIVQEITENVIQSKPEEKKQTEVAVVTNKTVKKTSDVQKTTSQETGDFTIQIMALLKPRDAQIFSRVSQEKLHLSYGSDGYCRYSYGRYSSYIQAIPDLKKLIRSGFKDAFIRNTSEIDNF